MVVGPQHRQRGIGFGLAERIHEAGRVREHFNRLADDWKRHRCPAVRDILQAGQVVVRERGVVDQLFQHGRYDEGVRHALRLDGFQPFLGVELAQNRDFPSAPQRGHDVHNAGDVVQRRAQQRGAARSAVRHFHGAGHVIGEAAIGQHDALGQRGRPARVHQDRQIFLVHLGLFDVGRALGQDVVVVHHAVLRRFDADVFLDAAELRFEFVHQIDVAVADEQHLTVGRGNHVFQFGRLGAVVERNERGAQCGRGVVGFDVLVAVGLKDGYAVARLYPLFPQAAGEPLDPLAQCAVGQAGALEGQDFLVGKHHAGNADELGGVHTCSLHQSEKSPFESEAVGQAEIDPAAHGPFGQTHGARAMPAECVC